MPEMMAKYLPQQFSATFSLKAKQKMELRKNSNSKTPESKKSTSKYFNRSISQGERIFHKIEKDDELSLVCPTAEMMNCSSKVFFILYFYFFFIFFYYFFLFY